MEVFIESFFSGKLFKNMIFNTFMGAGELVGHSGSTGSFAFYYPNQELFLVGDVNQSASPVSVRLAMSLK